MATYSLLHYVGAGAGAPSARPILVWSLDAVAGRLVELSGTGATARLSTAFALVRDAQMRDEPVAWVGQRAEGFYPPDAMASGIDVAALPVVRCVEPAAMVRAVEMLVRSGSFGLVIADLVWLGGAASAANQAIARAVSIAHQGRLVTLAKNHDTAIVFLTEKPAEADSLGSMVSLRITCERVSASDCTLRVVKDKRRGPGHQATLTFAPAPGM